MTMTTPAPGTPAALDAQLNSLADEATNIIEAADAAGRDLTADESQRIHDIFDTSKSTRHARDKAAERIELRGQLGGLTGEGVTGKACRRGQAASHPWVKAVLDRYRGPGLKDEALPVTANVQVPSVLAPGIFPEGKTGAQIAELCRPVSINNGMFMFDRRGPRDSRAATVPKGQRKPFTPMLGEQVTDRARVVAHLAWAHRTDLADSEGLADFIRDELLWGVAAVIDRLIVTGDGVTDADTDNFLGILNTPGLGAQPFTTGLVDTTRKAVTQLDKAGYTPTAWAVSPDDAEALDLLANDNGDLLGDGPFAVGPETLWSLPRVTSVAVPPGRAILGDWRYAVLAVREAATVVWRDAGEPFERNVVEFRGEEWAGFALARPDAFIEVEMAATPGGA